jgi:mono/diheme cytochrome c family protein
MTRLAVVLLSLLGMFPQVTLAQPSPAASTSGQALGHRLFAQSCAVCHLNPSPNAERYGPALWKETVEGREADVRDLIRTGSERMPGFRYDLKPAEIDAIIQYLATVPEPPTTLLPTSQH